MMENRKTVAFFIWFIYERPFLLYLIGFMLILFSSCATAPAPPKSYPYLPPQSEIERFERATELFYSEIPEVYDISHLRIGSMAKFRVELRNLPLAKPYYSVYIVRGVTSDPPEKKFIFDIENYYRKDTTFSHNYVKGFTFTHEAAPDYLTRVFFSDRVNQVNATFTPSPQDIGAFVTAGIIGGVLGLGTEALEQKRHREREQVDQELAQVLKERDLKTESKTKVVKFELISYEQLTIVNGRISCRVYAIQTISKKTLHYFRQNIPGTPYIEDHWIKIWVSNDVPFGVVKKEVQSVKYLSSDREPTKYSTFVEVVEFKY